MEKLLIGNLKSVYILKTILDHIKDKKVILKLFVHSKKFQNKLGIRLFDFQKIFFKKFSFENYLCFNTSFENDIAFDKDEIKNSLRNDLLQYKFDSNNIINNKEYLIYYFKKYYEKINEEKSGIDKEYKILIDIYSPFFETLSKTEIFSDIFNVKILPSNIIKNNNLKNDYINSFNEINSNYSSLSLYYGEKEDLNILKEFNININNIKNIIIYILNLNDNFLISFDDKYIFKNLQKLRIDSKYSNTRKINANSFENINNLNSLEDLELNDLIFKGKFIIKLYNLKKLYISNCKKIGFSKDIPYNIEILELNNCLLIEQNSSLKFPKLKKYNINNTFTKYSRQLTFFDIFDIKNNVSKYLITDAEKSCDIDKNLPIEYLLIKYASYYREIYQKMIEKIIAIKTLKYIDINLFNILNDDILKIKGENISIKEASILWLDTRDCILFGLQDKLPNLTKININISDMSQGWNQNSITSVEIIENPKCKVNQFSIDSFLCMNIKFYIQSFENLISVNFNVSTRFDISKNNFPLFNDNCKIIFKSLKSFQLIAEGCYRIIFDVLENLYNNLDKMPDLKSFVLKCNDKHITKEFSIKFIKKILSLKLNNIDIYLTNQYFFEKGHEKYSLNELKEIYSKFDINSFNHVCIRKFAPIDRLE